MRSTLLTGDPLEMLPRRFGDRVLARVFGASLDEALARGRAPESSRLLAARAQDIVSLRKRRSVAGSWEHLLAVARRAQPAPRVELAVLTGAGPRGAVPVCADQIIAAEPAIRDLISRLTARLPVPARGVALARVLLANASSPVYSRLAPRTLDAALEAAVAQLDPALPLLP
jgi:hypothetical protein